MVSKLGSGDTRSRCHDGGTGGGSNDMGIRKRGCRDWTTRMAEPVGGAVVSGLRSEDMGLGC